MKFKDIKVHDINEKPDRAFIIITNDSNGIPSIHLCRFIPENYELVVRHHHAVGWIYADPEHDFKPEDGSWWLCRPKDAEDENFMFLAKYSLASDLWVIDTPDYVTALLYDDLTPIKEINV